MYPGKKSFWVLFNVNSAAVSHCFIQWEQIEITTGNWQPQKILETAANKTKYLRAFLMKPKNDRRF